MKVTNLKYDRPLAVGLRLCTTTGQSAAVLVLVLVLVEDGPYRDV